MLILKTAIPQCFGIDVKLRLEAGITRYVYMVIFNKIQLVITLVHGLSRFDLRLQLLELQLRWLEALVARYLGPELVCAVLERVVADWLFCAISGEELIGVGTYFLSVVETVVSESSWRVIDIWSVFV